MAHSSTDFTQDIDRVNRIPLIKTLLDVVCQTTGMGFAAVTRVTPDSWIACSVRDDIQFGLLPGGELQLETTICNDIRASHQPVVIDHVQQNEAFCNHPTPLRYGFQSYISFPIVLETGEFFGTLCAIDPSPAQLDNANIRGLFALFADLIAQHLRQQDLLEQSQRQAIYLDEQVQARTQALHASIADLQRSNENLQQFAYVASHDLQEPLRKVQAFGTLLRERRAIELGDDADLLTRMEQAANRMSILVKELLTYSRISTQQEATTAIPLNQVVDEALKDLELAIADTKAQIHVAALPVVRGDGRQLQQLFQNLLSNALKFRQAHVPPQIYLTACLVSAVELPQSIKPARKVATYHRIDVVDNGIGFNEKYVDRIFNVFQRLHAKAQYSGTGIGLAICEKVAINQGGAITASSAVNQGATFQVYLPVVVD